MKSQSENMKENINSQNTKEGNTDSSQSKILTIPNLLSFFRLCLHACVPLPGLHPASKAACFYDICNRLIIRSLPLGL